MPELLEPTRPIAEPRGAIVEADALSGAMETVCRRFPPLWDLPNFIAVHPLLGHLERPIAEAAADVADALDADIMPRVDAYRALWRAGSIDAENLRHASARSGHDAGRLSAILDGRAEPPTRPSKTFPTFAERIGGPWHSLVIRQAARWCAVHASGGGTFWPIDPMEGLFASWREAARADRSLEIDGLRGWRAWLGQVPDNARTAIAAMVDRLDLDVDDLETYFHRLLGGLRGWASYLRREGWQDGSNDPGAMLDLLAIRIVGDAAAFELAPRRTLAPAPAPAGVEDESVRLAFQEAFEDSYSRTLLRRILSTTSRADASDRPTVQAVFCIDVRSEPIRRHLEARDPGIQTLGFAGFFGVPVEWRGDGTARCPALLRPAIAIGQPAPRTWRSTIASAWKAVMAAPGSAFAAVELLGALSGVGLAIDAIAGGRRVGPSEAETPVELHPDGQGGGLSIERRVELASGLLTGLSLGPRGPIARLVVLFGHEGTSANNPHAAALHCGACGGHGGALNARIAATILNDPDVREALAQRGRPIPVDTHFLAGVHETTVDRLTLLDLDRLPTSHRADVDRLRAHLEEVGVQVRIERAGALGLDPGQGGRLARILDRRARDGAEVRPEWGLARNAAFIAARRARTLGVDLEGRAFLHEYDPTADPEGSTLTAILSAPMVVAAWINGQYLASTVDNRNFGSGTKALHNRVGTHGVVVGNGGDLRAGLSIQSVHAPDGRWFHDPIRLQVIVEAPRDRIERALSKSPTARDLVNNGWVRLFAIDPEGSNAARWIPGQGWEDPRG